MKLSFRIYEIEHEGDLDDATDAITKAGATVLKVLGVDFDGEGSAAFTVETADDRETLVTKLEEEGLCL